MDLRVCAGELQKNLAPAGYGKKKYACLKQTDGISRQ
jgi:hypothetical protein